MSKAKKQKPRTYPFLFLMAWVRPYHAAGERCSRCGAEAVYAYEHYVDIARMAQLRSSGLPEKQAIDAAWFAALDDQLTGRYRRAQTTYHCSSCTQQLIAHHCGEDAATMTMIPVEIMGHLSILLLNRLASRDDSGQHCLAVTAARTIEDVARALLQPERETTTLPRKKETDTKEGQETSEEMDKDEFLRQAEELIADLERKMVLALEGSPLYDLETLIRAWTQAQGLWLQQAVPMSRDQARDELVAFANSHQFARWMEGKRPGPPPNVLSKWKQAK